MVSQSQKPLEEMEWSWAAGEKYPYIQWGQGMAVSRALPLASEMLVLEPSGFLSSDSPEGQLLSASSYQSATCLPGPTTPRSCSKYAR